MKTTILLLFCALLGNIASAQQPTASATRAVGSQPSILRLPTRQVYLRGGNSYLIVQRGPGGLQIYRQAGKRIVPLR